MKNNYDIAIIGGSAAGITAAVTARKHYPNKNILLIREEDEVLVPCGIPYIFGTLKNIKENVISDEILLTNKIDFINQKIANIDKNKKIIVLENSNVVFDKLILATGSSPIIPPIPGIDKKNIFPIYKRVTYLNALLDKINQAKDIVIIGGGFIGVEFAEECKKNRNVNITLIELQQDCLIGSFDKDFCETAAQLLIKQGIVLKLNTNIKACLGNEKVDVIELTNGEKIKADVVILGVGVFPNVELAKLLQLEIGDLGGIKVNSAMKTSCEDIFACGDCVESELFLINKPGKVNLASIATMQARIAGANLYKIKRTYKGVVGIVATVISNYVFASAGFTEREALQKNFKIIVGEAEAPNRHPGTMPNMQKIKVKLVFNHDNQTLIGGQIFGGYDSAELVNVIGTLILNKLTANDIVTSQFGTHPAVTASPIMYQIVNAAENASIKM